MSVLYDCVLGIVVVIVYLTSLAILMHYTVSVEILSAAP